MAPLDHLAPLTPKQARRSLGLAGILFAVAAALALIATVSPDPTPSPAGPAAVRTVEDWRGNSARITVLPAE